MDVERIDGTDGPFYRVSISDRVVLVGPRTLADPKRFAEALVVQTGHLGRKAMTDDATKLCSEIEARAKRLREMLSPRLPGMIVARTLIGLAATNADLQRLTDSVEGALGSNADGAGGTDK